MALIEAQVVILGFFFVDSPVHSMRMFLRQENWSSIKIERVITKMAVESTILGKSPLTNFQALTEQISLLAGLHTFNNHFHKKAKKQPTLPQ